MVQLAVEGVGALTWETYWPRRFRMGDAEGYCGEAFIVTISSAFTPAEDELFRWVVAQDSVELYGLSHLSDGRDIMLFERRYVKQSEDEARTEHRLHLRRVLEEAGALTPVVFSAG